MIFRINFWDEVCCRRELLGACLRPNPAVSHNIEPVMVLVWFSQLRSHQKFVLRSQQSEEATDQDPKKYLSPAQSVFSAATSGRPAPGDRSPAGQTAFMKEDQTKRCGRPFCALYKCDSKRLPTYSPRLLWSRLPSVFSPTIKTDTPRFGDCLPFGTEKLRGGILFTWVRLSNLSAA